MLCHWGSLLATAWGHGRGRQELTRQKGKQDGRHRGREFGGGQGAVLRVDSEALQGGAQNSRLCVTWDLVRIANAGAWAQTAEPETLETREWQSRRSQDGSNLRRERS